MLFAATLRLVGGTSKEGRLEILHNGAWGTVCGWAVQRQSCVRSCARQDRTAACGLLACNMQGGRLPRSDARHSLPCALQICDDLWSSTDTRVACKQLNPLWLTGGTARCCGVKPGSGIIWLTKVSVRGEGGGWQGSGVFGRSVNVHRLRCCERSILHVLCGCKPTAPLLPGTQCSGSETRIENCPPASKGTWGNTKCTHGEDIWIKCN